MSLPHKPNDYSTVSPYLIVDGATQTIEFLKMVFNAKELRRMLNENGSINHAELRIDNTVVMLADSVDGWESQPSHVHVSVSDVDATYKQALAAGAISVQEPIQKDDSDKRGGVKDAGGTTWWISTQVE